MQQGGLLLGGGLLQGVPAARALAMQQGGMSMPMPNEVRPLGGKATAKTLDAMKLEPFVDQLLLPQLMHAEGKRSSTVHGAVDAPYYHVRIREVSYRMHRDLPPARQWSYGDGPGPVLFEAKQNEGVLVDWVNELPAKHILPIVGPMHGMEYLAKAPATRTVTHLHGARVPSISDGYPEDWFGPGHNKLCYYPNRQDATGLWIHDHAMGVSRLNVFAGLMGWYLLRDDVEAGLGLPSG